MPELPDIVVYLEALERKIRGETVRGFRVASPSVLRTFDPPYDSIVGHEVVGLRRIGKRIVWDMSDGKVLVVHLMVAGRLKWSDTRGVAVPKKVGLCAWDFNHGTLTLTEQGTRKRAGIWVFSDAEKAAGEDRGGAEPLEITELEFAGALTRENRTLKRALTDPRIFSGIGNAFSDEILWEAKLSPVKRTAQLTDAEISRLYQATQSSLVRWTDLLRQAVGEGWPDRVTAFRPEMAVHGKYGEPCPVCGSKVQRIVYASNETNYCATCQTGGKLLADRSLSRLLKDDWPATLEELEESRS